jgi:hypothetical protein
MRSPVDLLDLPYVFSQVGLLTGDEFRRKAAARGFPLVDEHLETLHRVGAIVPIFRLARERAELARAARGDIRTLRRISSATAPTRETLDAARRMGLLHDPGAERQITRKQRQRTVQMRTYETSVYVYADYQLSALPWAMTAWQFLANSRGRRRDLDPKPHGKRLRRIAIAAAALEAVYYPRVVGNLRLSSHEEFGHFDDWRRQLPESYLTEWLGVDAAWLHSEAAMLLREADRIDPMRDWVEVIARAEPAKWGVLRGSALSAMDLRITAELLLAYHDDLSRDDASAVADQPAQTRIGRRTSRLKASRPLDEVLTDFGLSPHPRLVLVVEGDTEMLLVPPVMQLLRISTDEDFISVQNAEGVERDLGSLLGFLAPRVKPDPDGEYLDLIRPPTRFLIVFDPEGRASTTDGRAKRRRAWVQRLERALPVERRQHGAREEIDALVELVTWNARGESFEFAHFTDLELAKAILQLPRSTRTQSLAEARKTVAALRARNGNLASMFPHSSKGRLAEELRPVLERKLERARARDTLERMPLVRVLDRALDLAYEYPRRNLVIGSA